MRAVVLAAVVALAVGAPGAAARESHGSVDAPSTYAPLRADDHAASPPPPGSFGRAGPIRAPGAPAEACYLTATHSLSPTEVRLGDSVHVEVHLDVDCGGSLPRQFVLGLPAWPSAADADRARAAARGFVAAATQNGLEVGLVLGHTDPPFEYAPSGNGAVLNAALNTYLPSASGAPTAALVGSARAMLFADVEERLKHVVILDHPAAVHATDLRTRFEMEATLDLGMDVTHVCVGPGDCPELPGAEHYAVSWAGLETRLRQIADLPGGHRVQWATIRQDLGPTVDYVHPSANIRPSAMGSSSEANFLEWRAEFPQDQVVFEFDARPFAVGQVAVAGAITVEGLTNAGVTLTWFETALPPITVRPEPARPSTCRMRAAAESSAASVPLYGAVTATLTLQTDCPPSARDVDVVLAFDQSRSMEGLPSDAIIAAAERFIQRIRLDRSRVAIMMFDTDVDVRTGLIQDRDSLLAALQPMTYGGDTALALAIDTARTVLDDRRPEAMPAMVLLTDGHVRDDPLPAAAWAKAAGIRIAVVCFSPTLACDDEVFQVASTQYLFLAKDADELFEAYDELGEFMAQPDVQRLSVTLSPSPGLAYTGIPPHPNPPERGSDGMLAWTRAEPLQGASVLELPLHAVGVGSWPLADTASAYYVDSVGGVGAVSIPLPHVEVIPPEPTGPCEPAADRTALPSEVQTGGVVTVTSRLDVTCQPADTQLDVVFAIDHSFSMGTLGRLDNAVRAVDQFLVSVDDADAWHGLVAFNESITHQVPVGADPEAVRSVLATLRPDGGTDIGRAIDSSLALLEAGRQGSRKVMVILTDGANSTSGTPILDAAGRAHEAGVLVVTVCAGGLCDPDLALAATAPEYAFSVADAADLTDVFARLANVVTRVDPTAIELQELITPGFVLRSGQPAPEPAPWDPALWLWTFPAPGHDGATISHSLRADLAGRHPVALSALVRYTLDGGASGEFYLPAAEVDVRPSDPSGLPTAQPLPTPGAPPTEWSVFLPQVAVP